MRPQLYPHLLRLGASPLCELGLADDSVARSTPGTPESDWSEWRDAHLMPALVQRITQPHTFQRQADAQQKKRAEQQQCEVEAEEKEVESAEEQEQAAEQRPSATAVLDLEDVGLTVKRLTAASTRSTQQPLEHSSDVQLRVRTKTSWPASAAAVSSVDAVAVRPMLTDQLRAALSKQGYKLLGSHSGVKLCRWTKAMLRGRGGCYKNTSASSQHSDEALCRGPTARPSSADRRRGHSAHPAPRLFRAASFHSCI